MTHNTDILNAKALGESIGKPAAYVTAMKRAGYEFQYGRITTRKHALEWLAKNKGFTPSHYLAPCWKASATTLANQPV